MCSMDYPKFIVTNQKEESISLQRVKRIQPRELHKIYDRSKVGCMLLSGLIQTNKHIFDQTYADEQVDLGPHAFAWIISESLSV